MLIAYPDDANEYIDKDGKEIEGSKDSVFYSKVSVKILKVFDVPNKYQKQQYFATEIIPLAENEVDELSNLLVNFKVKKWPKLIFSEPHGCYQPRNAILFLDEKDKVIGYLEICFECEGYHLEPDSFQFNNMNGITACDGIFTLLKELFRKKGIQYGIKSR